MSARERDAKIRKAVDLLADVAESETGGEWSKDSADLLSFMLEMAAAAAIECEDKP